MPVNALSKLKIMVVDDNKHMCRLLDAILTGFGCKNIVHATSGNAALNLLVEETPDIIFVDILMDNMSGIELTHKIRNDGTSPNPLIPVIIVSGYGSIEHVNKARNAGCNEFLVKPVASKHVFSRLQAVIERPRPFVRTKVYFGPDRRRLTQDSYSGANRRDIDDVVTLSDEPKSVFG